MLPEKTDKEGINVDLGRFDKVDYVLVNGLPVTDYTMDGYVLSIPYPALIGNSLTIGVKNNDGTISVRTYQLVYNKDRGYTAYRLYGRNDIIDTLLRPFKLLPALITLIIDKIKSL